MAGPDAVVVSVTDDHLEQIDDVAAQLAAAGMRVEQVLRPIGVITGSAPPAVCTAVAALAGVAAVEPDRDVRLAPPDSDVQ